MRILDILISGTLLMLTAPIILVCAILIRLGSSGPAIFAQTRVGQNEQLFTCYKLRTMQQGTVSAASHETSALAVTSAGRILRASKLDELPQLWNVLTGTMSLVGPRPCLPVQHDLIAARRRREVFSVRPGVTGVAQVQGVDMSDPERLALLDAEWVRSATVGRYFALIIQTGLGQGRGDRVQSSGLEGRK